jgi:uncharacterized protein
MKIELNRTSEDFSEKLALEDNPEALELEAEGVAFENPIRVELLVSKNQDQLICQGQVTASAKLECSRCLAGYGYTITSELNFVVDLAGGSEEARSEEEGYFVVDPSSASFEIDHLVREVIILSLPLKPLCSEDCKGLCPVCGIGLNSSQCKCVREESDPRWDQLKGLSKKNS